MDAEKWPLTSRAIADAERYVGPSELDPTDDEEPERELPDAVWVDSGSGPGWEVRTRPKLRPDREKLS